MDDHAGPEQGAAEPEAAGSYALGVANSSYGWYRQAATRARRFHRTTEVLQLVVSAAIPVTAVLFTGNTAVPAVLGAVVVVVGGLRAQFHWHDDYLRFSQSREAVEAERRLYYTHAAPYEDPGTRDAVLAQAITAIEQREMSVWTKLRTGKSRDQR